MRANRISLGLLLLALALLFVPTIIELAGGREVDPHVTQLIGFTLTLVALFGRAYFDASRLERQIEEERSKETRAHQTKMLEQIEKWAYDCSGCLDDIKAMRELSEKDPDDDKIIVEKDKRISVAHTLIRLDSMWLVAMAKAADLVGVAPNTRELGDLPSHHQDLLTNMYLLGSQISKIKEMLISSQKIPEVDHLSGPIAMITRSLDMFQQRDL